MVISIPARYTKVLGTHSIRMALHQGNQNVKNEEKVKYQIIMYPKIEIKFIN